MGNMADGLADGMLQSSARRANSAASAALHEADIQAKKARAAQANAEMHKAGVDVLVAKIKALETAFEKTDAKLGVAVHIIRGVNDAIEDFPMELREKFRERVIQRSRQQLDEVSKKKWGEDWLPIAKDMQTPKLLGVV